MSPVPTVAVCMAVFNRSAVTDRCLQSLKLQSTGVEGVQVFVLDDASTDGTDLVLKRHAEDLPTTILTGRDLYWCRGMARAMAAAQAIDPDYYLWLNDDVELDTRALEQLLVRSKEAGPETIVAGRTQDSTGTTETYGGWSLRNAHRPMTVIPYSPDHPDRELVAVNDNIVLIPRAVVQRIGIVDDGFRHGFGDFDYSLRARAAGLHLEVLPSFLGVCDLNDPTGTWKDGAVPRGRRLRLMLRPKGMPPHDVIRFLRRHAPRTWILQVLREYAGVLLRIARKRNYY